MSYTVAGGGSGFIVGSDGIIVTNKHVVDDSEARYKVVFSDGKEYDIKSMDKDPVLDIAILKIDANRLPKLDLGDSNDLKLGQTVVAIGNSLAEFENTVTRGVISGMERRVQTVNKEGQTEMLEQAIQTDAAINFGNSGGPLIDIAGKVIGINTAVSVQGQSIGFAIPINSIKKSIKSFEQTGKIIRPWLGVRYIPVTEKVKEEKSLPIDYGVLLVPDENGNASAENSPARKAGFLENDLIYEVDGKKIDLDNSLSKMILTYEVGDRVEIDFYRDGKETKKDVTLEEYKI